MRLILMPLCAVLIAAAAPVVVPAPSPDPMLPGYTEPPKKWTSIEDAVRDKRCSDRIEQVRDTAGQPKLDREAASAEKPLLIAAVDKRIDGFAVIQMAGDVNDVRLPPAPDQGPIELLPAR